MQGKLLLRYVSWLIHSEGVTTSDKVLLFFIKLYYIGLRISPRLALGKKRRTRLSLKGQLGFLTVWYESYNFWKRVGKRKSPDLLKFKMPKYNFTFYCRNNKDELMIMTYHEHDILEHYFTPKEGDIFVDVGAHIGKYTIIASKRVGLNGKVIAIEADPGNFDLLNRNIQLNNLSNVIALNYAVYSKEEIIKLYLPSAGGEEESSSYTNTIMYDRAAKGEEKFVKVKANTLDYLLHSNMMKQEEVNWIKIDVEGAEYEVLKGAKDIISKSKDITILMEIHNLSAGNSLYKPIREYLSPYNFKIEFEKAYPGGERHVIARKY